MFREKVLGAALALAIVLAGLVIGEAQITVPHTFTSSVPASQVNNNFSTLGTGALNRSGGTITGNISVDPGVTLDGIDIGASLGTSGDLDIDSLNLRNTGASALDVAGGINAGSGNVGIVDTTGKIPAISSTYFSSLSGANLTGIVSTGVTTTRTTPSFSAANYTASGTMTWTVASGDVNHNTYFDLGSTMFWTIALFNTSTSGTGAAEFRITVPASRTIAANSNGTCSGSESTTARTPLWSAVAGSTYVIVYKDDVATPWTSPVSDTTTIRCNMMVFF